MKLTKLIGPLIFTLITVPLAVRTVMQAIAPVVIESELNPYYMRDCKRGDWLEIQHWVPSNLAFGESGGGSGLQRWKFYCVGSNQWQLSEHREFER